MTTRETINLGTSANDGTGDTLRSGGGKINRNFVKIFQMLGSDSDYLSENISFDSDAMIYSGNTYTSRLGFTEPTASRTVTLPDATGIVILDTSTQTLTNKTLTNPTIIDSNSKNLLTFSQNASAVNSIQVQNNSTGNTPSLNAIGTDTNITLSINGKGIGSVKGNKFAVSSETLDSDGAASATVGYTILNGSSTLSISLTDGSVIGEQKIFTNKGSAAATITPSSFANGTSVTLQPNSGCQMIWDNTNWFIIGAFHDSDVTIA